MAKGIVPPPPLGLLPTVFLFLEQNELPSLKFYDKFCVAGMKVRCLNLVLLRRYVRLPFISSSRFCSLPKKVKLSMVFFTENVRCAPQPRILVIFPFPEPENDKSFFLKSTCHILNLNWIITLAISVLRERSSSLVGYGEWQKHGCSSQKKSFLHEKWFFKTIQKTFMLVHILSADG